MAARTRWLIALAALVVLVTAVLVALRQPPVDPQFDRMEERERPEPNKADGERLRTETDEPRPGH